MKCIPGGVLEGVRVRPRSEPHRHGSFSPHGLGQVFSFECRGCKIRARRWCENRYQRLQASQMAATGRFVRSRGARGLGFRGQLRIQGCDAGFYCGSDGSTSIHTWAEGTGLYLGLTTST